MQLKDESDLPFTFVTTADWATGLSELADYYAHYGVGIFGQYPAFRWQAGRLVGIAHPRPDSAT